MGPVMAVAAALVLVSVLTLWAWSVRIGDASVVDPFWGPGFALVAWGSVVAAGPTPRGLLQAGLASLWGLRLGAYLAWRRRGHGEDRRYADMRVRHGDRFAQVSLVTVFLLQGALMWVISLPLQAGAALGRGAPLGPLDALGALVVLAGVAVEAVADAQLARFLADPGHRGRVMDRGLWAWSRHPNYFGDFVVWWGLGLVALGSGAWWSLVGPAVMSLLLMRVSGVPLLEETIAGRRPGYAAYAARTSAFFPRPPRRPGPATSP
jgi:steroid 5-alpha reductase family enzyme